jgi:hypothetical protein
MAASLSWFVASVFLSILPVQRHVKYHTGEMVGARRIDNREGRQPSIRGERAPAVACVVWWWCLGRFCVSMGIGLFELALWRRGSVLGS